MQFAGIRKTPGISCGFTLVEILIVVAIVGMLAAIAIPAFVRARKDSAVKALANDLRVFDGAFQEFAMNNRGFPTDTPGWRVLPGGMDGYIKPGKWAAQTPCGGWYWYKSPVFAAYDFAPCIGIIAGPDAGLMAELDDLIDDGKALTGRLRWAGASYYYIMK